MKKNKKLLWVFLLFMITITLFLLSCFHIEPDYFWHIKAGEYMVNHHLLREDVFSWFVYGKYWMSHEWLYDVIIYFLRCLFSNYHIFVYLLICLLFLSSFFFFIHSKDLSKNVPYSLVLLTFYAIIFAFYVQARPHMISYCLLSITIWFLVDLYRNEESKKIYFLPLISIIWANVHGGSSNLPYLFCFLFWMGGLFSFQFKKIEAKRFSKVKLRKYFLVMILCMMTVCINLHGFKMFLYPYQNMLDKTMLSNISEWQSTSLNIVYHYIYYGFIVFIMFTYLFSDRKIQFIDLIITGFVVFLGLKSIRFWGFAPITVSYFLFDYVKERKVEKGTYLGVVVVCIILSFFIIDNMKNSNIFSKNHFCYLNSRVIAVLKEEKPKRLFNMYGFGGELIYYDIPVFIDGRADLYSPYNYKDYLNISELRKDYVSLIQKYDFDYFLVREKYPIYTYLKYDSRYELIYSSKDIYLFKRI